MGFNNAMINPKQFTLKNKNLNKLIHLIKRVTSIGTQRQKKV